MPDCFPQGHGCCVAADALRKQLADVTAQRDQANRTCSDALARAERAETEAGDLRKRLDACEKLCGELHERELDHDGTLNLLEQYRHRNQLNQQGYEREMREHDATRAKLERANSLLRETIDQPGVWDAYWLARRDAILEVTK